MKLEDIKREWKKDSQIDPTNFDSELLKVTKLHSKYFNIIVDEKKRLRFVEIEYNRLRKIKREYYLGRIPRDVVTRRGWKQIEHEIKTTEVKDYLNGDKELCEIEARIALSKIKLEFLEEIIRAVHGMGYNIKEAAAWIRFKHGEPK